jgi:putative transposase
MSERRRFIERRLQGELMADLCEEFGVSRKTGQKFWKRFQKHGFDGLKDQSRAPKSRPHTTPQEIVDLILATKAKYESWGAPKIQAWLTRKRPDLAIPSVAAVHRWLAKEGLVKKKRARKRAATGSWNTLKEPSAPNEVWCVDFKGQFKLKDGSYCYPLTITDLFSRYLIRVEALEDTSTDPAREVFVDVFSEYGVPKTIRSDNGAPFASSGLAGLSKLSVYWKRCGIELERIEPGHPEQNGQHERMHLTLKQETALPAKANALQQQVAFDRFREVFNNERPHEALGQETPSSVYCASTRLYRAPGPLAYPLHEDTRKISARGLLAFRRQIFYVGIALAGEEVGLREIDPRRWQVTFMDLDLGFLDEREGKFEMTV